MSELDVAKEQIAYLKFWLGILVITDISFVRLASLKRRERKFTLGFRWLLRSCGHYRGNHTAAPPYRATYRKLTRVLAMEIIVAALLIAVSLVLLALVVDATRHPK
jgi:hypothetical protein